MPTPTYVALATVTLSGETDVTFSSIPATYRDIIAVVNPTATAGSNLLIQVNNDTASNYSRMGMYNSGSTPASFANTNNHYVAFTGGMDVSEANLSIVQFMDYSATDKHKTTLARGTSPDEMTIGVASRWANTSAITSVTALTLSGESFESGTTLSLYGIEA